MLFTTVSLKQKVSIKLCYKEIDFLLYLKYTTSNMFTWSKTDAILIPLMLAVFIVVALVLRFLLRNKGQFIKKIPLQIITLVVVVIEVAKQIYYHNNSEFTYYVLPIHFCSLFMVLMPLSQFCGNKAGSFFKPMTFVYSSLVFILVLANPNALIGQSTSDIFGSFHNIHTFIFHFSVIAYFIFSIALGDYQPKLKHCMNVSFGIVIYAAYAIPCAYHLQTNYVNILYCYFEPLEKFRLWAGQVWYNVVLFLIGVASACFICILSYLINRSYLRLLENMKSKRNAS